MKLFKSSNVDLVKECQSNFRRHGILETSVLVSRPSSRDRTLKVLVLVLNTKVLVLVLMSKVSVLKLCLCLAIVFWQLQQQHLFQ